MAQHYGTPEDKVSLNAEFEAAKHIGSNGKTYTTPWAWKFNSLQYEFKQTHPRDEFFLTLKQETYEALMPQIEALVSGETDLIANMANVAAVLHEAFGFWWTGFYRVTGKGLQVTGKGLQELVLGPFQGPMACTRIPYGKGVCGTAWQRGETVIVPDVHAFAGHIACSSESNSEIVVPIWQDGKVIAVLDIDSKDYNTFDETDKIYLEQIAKIISKTK